MVGLALYLAKYNVLIVFEFRKCGEINLCGGKHVIVVILDVSLSIVFFFFFGVWGSNPEPCIYYTLFSRGLLRGIVVVSKNVETYFANLC
jgi:hypothetical protein